MGKPSPPKPPDPVALANAQGAANADTARLQSQLNNVNQYGPYGSVTYEKNGDQWTQYVRPNQDVLQQIDATTDAQNRALGIATNQLGRVDQALSNPLTLNGLPNLESEAIEPGMYGYDALGAPQMGTSFNQGQPIQYGFNQGQPVQGQVGPTDFTADRNAITNAVIGQATSRLDPMYAQREDQLRNLLSNQGLSQNSAAYQTALGNFNRDRADAYNQAIYSGIQQGAGEQQQLFGQRLAQGQFANQAAGQQYAQNQGAAAFNNQATGQQFQQGLSAQDFANQARQQDYQNQQSAIQSANAVRQQMFANQLTNANLTNQARQQALQERAYVQNQPINQLSALMGLNQVQLPQGAPQGNTSVAPTDVLGAYALNQQQQNANYQAKMGMYGGALGGLFNLGSSAILASDRRLKRDIVPLGERGGVNWYAFRFEGRPELHVGVMAQEVRKTHPWAVERIGPWLHVNYAFLEAA